MASRLATACSKKVKIVIGLFHNKEGDRGTCTESKSDEERFKELAHPRVDMVGHDVTHRVVRAMPGTKGMTEPAIIKSSVELKPE